MEINSLCWSCKNNFPIIKYICTISLTTSVIVLNQENIPTSSNPNPCSPYKMNFEWVSTGFNYQAAKDRFVPRKSSCRLTNIKLTAFLCHHWPTVISDYGGDLRPFCCHSINFLLQEYIYEIILIYNIK